MSDQSPIVLTIPQHTLASTMKKMSLSPCLTSPMPPSRAAHTFSLTTVGQFSRFMAYSQFLLVLGVGGAVCDTTGSRFFCITVGDYGYSHMHYMEALFHIAMDGSGSPISIDEACDLLAGQIVYVASPYGDSEPLAVRQGRYAAVLQACGDLVSRGVRAYSPVAYTHNLAALGASPPDGWYGFDLSMLPLFQYVAMLMLPNWEKSVGMRLEASRAAEIGIPVVHVRPAPDT